MSRSLVSPTTSLTYLVEGMSCEHCRVAITEEVGGVAGVDAVDVDLATKLVHVHGSGLEDAAVRAAIDDAGYDALLR
jgi:copper chaperone CopZ